MSLLAVLDEGPTFGLDLKREFETRTSGIWPLNAGQIYTTLARLQREGLVRSHDRAETERRKRYAITPTGHASLERWFDAPFGREAPPRDRLLLKLVMAAGRRDEDVQRVIQRERRSAIQLLQEHARVKDAATEDAGLAWFFLLEGLIFRGEGRVRWLDSCEEHYLRRAMHPVNGAPTGVSSETPPSEEDRP
jgi:DNA-binding PadR family transcriptional regulator